MIRGFFVAMSNSPSDAGDAGDVSASPKEKQEMDAARIR